MFDVIGLAKNALGVVDKLAAAWNNWRAEKREQKIEDRGRELQSGDDAKELVKRGRDAAKNRDDVHRMSDDDLNNLLR